MIYLDYAASSPPYPQAADLQHRIALECFGNPGGLHAAAGSARKILRDSRRNLAALLGVRENEIFFTSGGTEANNWAVKLACGSRRHIVASAMEHKSILESLRQLEGQGHPVTLVTPDRNGRILPDAVEAALRPDTGLLCCQAVNNETGVIQDVAVLAALAEKQGIPYLCDGVQSFGHVDQPLKEADFVSISAHKLGGPRGIGCLVIRQDRRLQPLLHGGGQELGLRSGTENVAGIAAFALAAELAVRELPREETRLRRLGDRFVQLLQEEAPGVQVNGDSAPRHPGILSCRFPGRTAEELVTRLDLAGICVSPGAACAARDTSPSHVLLAIGLSPKEAAESVRFSFGRLTTEDELIATARAVGEILRKAW